MFANINNVKLPNCQHTQRPGRNITGERVGKNVTPHLGKVYYSHFNHGSRCGTPLFQTTSIYPNTVLEMLHHNTVPLELQMLVRFHISIWDNVLFHQSCRSLNCVCDLLIKKISQFFHVYSRCLHFFLVEVQLFLNCLNSKAGKRKQLYSSKICIYISLI